MFSTNPKHSFILTLVKEINSTPAKTNIKTDIFFLPSSSKVSFTACSICCLQRSIFCCKTYLETGTKGKLRKSSNKIPLLLYLDFALQEQTVSFQTECLCINERMQFKVFQVMPRMYASCHRLRQLRGENVCCLVLKQFSDIL